MKLINILLLLLTLGIILSCDKDETVAIPEKTEYSFVKIEFLYTAESEKNELLGETVKDEYVNRADTAYFYIYKLTDVFETSQFTGIDTSVINNITNCPLIAVPLDIFENKINLGIHKWTISNNTESKECDFDYGFDSMLEPGIKLIINLKIFYTEIKTKYRLTLINNKEHKEQTFEGIWIGKRPFKYDLYSVYSESD